MYSVAFQQPVRGLAIRNDNAGHRADAQYSEPRSSPVVFGQVATYQPKKFGFITPDGGDKDVFFSSKALPEHLRHIVCSGTRLRFVRSIDPNGKPCAAQIDLAERIEQPAVAAPAAAASNSIIRGQRLAGQATAGFRPGPKLIPRRRNGPLKSRASELGAVKTTSTSTSTVAPVGKSEHDHRRTPATPITTPTTPGSASSDDSSAELEESIPSPLQKESSTTLANLHKKVLVQLPGSDVPSFNWVKMPDDNGENPGDLYPDQGSLGADYSGYSFPPEEDESESESESGSELPAILSAESDHDSDYQDQQSRHHQGGQGGPETLNNSVGSMSPKVSDQGHVLNNQLMPGHDTKFTRKGTPKATIPCRYFGSARGCSKEGDCLYSHDKPWAIRLCDAIVQNKQCEYGDQCRFRHKKDPEHDAEPRPRKTRRSRANPRRIRAAPFAEKGDWPIRRSARVHVKNQPFISTEMDEKQSYYTHRSKSHLPKKGAWGKKHNFTDSSFTCSFNFHEQRLLQAENAQKHANSWMPRDSPPARNQITKSGLRRSSSRS